MPKTNDYLDGGHRFAAYLLVRTLPGILSTTAIFALVLNALSPTLPLGDGDSGGDGGTATLPPPSLSPRAMPPSTAYHTRAEAMCWHHNSLAHQAQIASSAAAAGSDSTLPHPLEMARQLVMLWMVVLLISHSGDLSRVQSSALISPHVHSPPARDVSHRPQPLCTTRKSPPRSRRPNKLGRTSLGNSYCATCYITSATYNLPNQG